MFNKKEVTENVKLDAAIDAVLTALSNHEPGTKEYAATAGQLSTLYRVKETDTTIKTKIIDILNKQEESETNRNAKKAETDAKVQELKAKRKEIEASIELKEYELMVKREEFRTRNRPSPETLALIGGNLAGIVMILGYERANIITSKAFGLLTKLK
jgi:hypothetical protein